MTTRLERLVEQFETLGIDGFITALPEHRLFLTGFTGTSGWVLVTPGEALLITDFRYIEQAQQQTTLPVIRHEQPAWDRIAEELQRLGVTKLGFEADHLTYADVERWTTRFDFLKLVATHEAVEKIRRTKDESEVACLREAVRISDAAFTHVLTWMQAGMTERDVALELEFHMLRAGAERIAFATIVASGKRAALPHGVASEKRIETGDFVTMDFGAVYKGYHSDITRTIVVEEVTDQQHEVYHLVLQAQLAAEQGATPGMTGISIDKIARDVIEVGGYGAFFGHGLGHGVGLAIHEAPTLGTKGEQVVEDGHVITFEPGIYIPDWGGVRIEDLAVMRPNGPEILTTAPKELIVI